MFCYISLNFPFIVKVFDLKNHLWCRCSFHDDVFTLLIVLVAYTLFIVLVVLTIFIVLVTCRPFNTYECSDCSLRNILSNHWVTIIQICVRPIDNYHQKIQIIRMTLHVATAWFWHFSCHFHISLYHIFSRWPHRCHCNPKLHVHWL